jgi:hypothetical protein
MFPEQRSSGKGCPEFGNVVHTSKLNIKGDTQFDVETDKSTNKETKVKFNIEFKSETKIKYVIENEFKNKDVTVVNIQTLQPKMIHQNLS